MCCSEKNLTADHISSMDIIKQSKYHVCYMITENVNDAQKYSL